MQKQASVAQAYYQAIKEKDLSEIEKFLDPQVKFISPLTQLSGRQDVIDAIKKLCTLFKSLTIRKTFDSGNQSMVVYDFDFPEPIGIVRTAALLNISHGVIEKIELFLMPVLLHEKSKFFLKRNYVNDCFV